MLRYIDAFPERCHHPKEDRYLFRRPARARPGSARILDDLEAEHEVGARMIRELWGALARYREEGAAGFPAFAGHGRCVRGVPLGTHAQEEGGGLPAAEQSPAARGLGRDRMRRSAVTATAVRRRCGDRIRHACPQIVDLAAATHRRRRPAPRPEK